MLWEGSVVLADRPVERGAVLDGTLDGLEPVRLEIG